MSRDEREKFLAGVHVGVLGVDDPRAGGGPLLIPVWYDYTPGGTLAVQTGRDTVKARLMNAAGRFSLCVQDETAPYRYVSVEGPVVEVTDPADPDVRESMAVRYLGADEAVRYLDATRDQLRDDITLRMAPRRWRSGDFASFAQAIAEATA
ncbi:pyridoxamine 5'-phosphate oxidase family protein [Streptomonospora nanhaiensis]|uniref:pyridoxamine 5'-phosphate oxidase family protein n=1 Tax=Streptomonospora nanhaiensis TaxID=1323731 RepID=UPI001C3898C7|nr:pyridoxamine 5'-phosphate oxidase family protein [Streptomonospora nanhaiensis]MBV2365558.1 pyridoxamine 5'-phosphate oxidase family protein [Streptomonospora nanhaiensis]